MAPSMQIQALLQQLIPLAQRQGPGGTPPFLPSQTTGSPQGTPGGAQQPPPPPVPGVGAGGPSQPQSGGQQPQSSPSPYNIRQDPMSTVGSLPPPGPPSQKTQAPQFRGGPVASLLNLIGSFYNNKQKNEQNEAARAAQDLMQSIEGAKTTGDWTPTYTILHNNEKLFNKVYKGWLQKSEMQQKEKQKPEKVEPDVQGFEAGVKQYMQKKQQSPSGPPPQGSAPRSVGGYQLPAAAPQQQLQQQAVSAERQAQQQDPRRSLQGQLSSDEQRQAELVKTGMATTPEAQARLAEAQAKLKGEIAKTYSEVQIASQNAQKAQFELQRSQVEAQSAGEKGIAAAKEADAKYQKALVDLDISKSKLQLQMLKTRTGANVKAPAGLRQRYIAASQAEAAVQDILNSPRSEHGFTKQDVQDLQGLLRSAGSTSLAGSLPQWYGTHMPSWLGGSGKQDVQGMLDSIKAYKTGLKDTLDSGFPGWDGSAPKNAKEADEEDTDDEGETMDFEYDAQGNRVTKPDEKKPN